MYKGCVYLEGNLEINGFDPFNPNLNSREVPSLENINYTSPDDIYDFSFLDDIREITGYVVIFNTNIKTLRLKSLEIIRGRNKLGGNSLYVQSNMRLEKLDLVNLKGDYFSWIFLIHWQSEQNKKDEICGLTRAAWPVRAILPVN